MVNLLIFTCLNYIKIRIESLASLRQCSIMALLKKEIKDIEAMMSEAIAILEQNASGEK